MRASCLWTWGGWRRRSTPKSSKGHWVSSSVTSYLNPLRQSLSLNQEWHWWAPSSRDPHVSALTPTTERCNSNITHRLWGVDPWSPSWPSKDLDPLNYLHRPWQLISMSSLNGVTSNQHRALAPNDRIIHSQPTFKMYHTCQTTATGFLFS